MVPRRGGPLRPAPSIFACEEMRMRAALIALALLCAVTASGCAGARQTTTVRVKAAKPPARAGLRIGVVGPLDVSVHGAIAERGRMDQVAGDALVLVSALTADAATVAAAADAHPTSHFALVGASIKGVHRNQSFLGGGSVFSMGQSSLVTDTNATQVIGAVGTAVR